MSPLLIQNSRYLKLTLLVLFFCFSGHCAASFAVNSIDVVIPSAEKDLSLLNLCIAGIKENCPQIRRIIVVSKLQMTDQAEWFDETLYPFTKEDVALHLLKGDKSAAEKFLKTSSQVGWYYQQLLKFYALFVIPGLSSNVLILDSDTVFINPVDFLDAEDNALYNPGTELHKPYFEHMNCFLPGLASVYPYYSGVSHHMLFQYSLMQELFNDVENYHKIPLWQAFCRCVNLKHLPGSGASEYEIYFNYIFSKPNCVRIRALRWSNQSFTLNVKNTIEMLKKKGFHYVSIHRHDYR